MRKRWTKEEEELVIKHYSDSTPAEMLVFLNNNATVQQICHKAKRLGIRKSSEYLKKYGIEKNGRHTNRRVQWNKGIHYNAGGRSIETRFKPGCVPKSRLDIGSIKTRKDGYLYIKTEHGINKFRPLHHEVWKKHYGSYPQDGYVIAFKDGDVSNCDISNLELISRLELMQRNTIHNYPEELKKVIATRISLIRRIHDNYTKKRHKQTA